MHWDTYVCNICCKKRFWEGGEISPISVRLDTPLVNNSVGNLRHLLKSFKWNFFSYVNLHGLIHLYKAPNLCFEADVWAHLWVHSWWSDWAQFTCLACSRMKKKALKKNLESVQGSTVCLVMSWLTVAVANMHCPIIKLHSKCYIGFSNNFLRICCLFIWLKAN